MRALLLFGYTAHLACTAWFATLPDFRGYARTRPATFVVAPCVLVVASVAVCTTLPSAALDRALLAFFAWQFWHFHRQNLGLAALAARASGAGALSRGERRALTVTGGAGVAGLMLAPQLLALPMDGSAPLRAVAFAVWVAAALAGLAIVRRPPAFLGVYAFALLFFAPTFLFSNPYLAIAGLTIAHSWQYLFLMSLVAGPPAPRSAAGPAALFAVAIVGGAAMAAIADRPHGGGLLPDALFGLYLGLVMTHFVADAAIWRMGAGFGRRLVATRLPYLNSTAIGNQTDTGTFYVSHG